MRRITVPALSFLSGMAAMPAWADQPRPWGLWLQDAASPIMHRITSLNTLLTIVMVAIVAMVFGLLGIVIFRFRASRNPVPAQWAHHTSLEVAWTLAPVLVLVVIAFPSFRLLHAMDKAKDAELTIKVTGHQWYWSYSYPDQNIGFDANLVQTDDLKPGEPRLLATDTHLVLPIDTVVRIETTADDVIHSWSVPALGVKIDAIPGRLNETWLKIDRPGLYYGQCSQLCGVNHGFMPIDVEGVSKEEFAQWLAKNRQAAATGPARLAGQ